MKDKEKQIEEMAKLSFNVVDNKTNKYPDLYNLALKEDWAKDLMYCDMDGFAINEDGNLVLMDECGKVAYCPKDRFTVVFEDSVVLSREEYEKYQNLKRDVEHSFEYIQGYTDGQNKANKETAEKFAREVKEIAGIKALLEMSYMPKLFKVIHNVIIKEINELAKQFGCEVKE